MKVILAGPPRSGKSCLRDGLKKAIRAIPESPYPYVITACPDGEGAWFQESVNFDAEAAAEYKAAYKSKFTPEFVQRVADSVKNCQLPLTLVDIGGITSVENEKICSSATHAILLAGDSPDKNWEERLVEWRKFCDKLGLRIIAEIHSDYHETEDSIPILGNSGVYKGSVHHLERGEPIQERLTVQELAKILVNLVGQSL
jgi:CRISPR-associated protein Csx3